MKKMMCLLLAICMIIALAACGKQAYAENKEWTRQGYFMDENENILSVTRMDDVDEPGWYVGVMLGEDLIEDSWGGMLPQEGNTLHGTLLSSGSKSDLTVTVSEEGKDDLLLAVEGGETYRFKEYELPTATVVVTVNTEGWGYIAYAEGEDTPEIDTEYPAQSAYIGLAEPAVHTFVAWPQAGNLFVKWTKNGEDFSTEPQFTALLDESAEYVAVFEEDPDWVSPVLCYAGEYQCGRAHATVMSAGFEDAWITIQWGGSAWELAQWDIFGMLDTDTQTIAYSGCTKSNLVYDDDGELKSQETVYEGGTGTIVFHGDGTFIWHEDQSESGEDMVFERLPFVYEHDPRVNPEAMKDIVENPDAVYGFSPDPESTRLGSYAAYDWTDPKLVAKAQKERRAYHESMDSMTDILYRMREDGASIEEMARAVSEERNRLRLASYDDDPERLAEAKKSNLETYGHEEGPTPDELFEKYGSWTVVLQKAFSSNMGMDACCGLYDEYYWLYIELGYVEDDHVGAAAEQMYDGGIPDQQSMTFEEYLELSSENWFLTGKRKYTIQAMMVSKEISFHNELEVVDYTVTDDGITVVLKGSFDEMWTTKLSKVLSTYTKPDGSALSEADFAEKDVWIDMITRPEPDAYYAMYVPLSVSVSVETAWGDVLHTNLPNAPHGEGDYLVCRTGEDGEPDLSDVWVVNGVVFPEYYSPTSGNAEIKPAA